LVKSSAEIAMALFGSDAFSPREIAERVEEAGVAKTRLPIVSLIMLGMLAGAFIALGSLYYVVVASDPALGWAARRVLGGVAFSLGLLLVVVAGADGKGTGCVFTIDLPRHAF
jgi:formate transporter